MSTRTGVRGGLQTVSMVAVGLVLVAASAFAQGKPTPVLPDTEADKRVAGWIASFNTGDDAKMQQ